MSRTYREVKARTDKMSSGQFDGWRRDPKNREDVLTLDAGPNENRATRSINLAQPEGTQPTERYAVIKPCVMCRRDSAVASDFTGNVLCSQKCIEAHRTYIETATSEYEDFVENTPAYYQCAYNENLLLGRVDDLKIGVSEDVYKRCFAELTRAGKLLLPISLDDLLKMLPAEYDRREQLDPNLGGHKKAIEAGAARQGQTRPAEMVVGTVQPDREAIDRANKARPVVVDRHAGVTQARNGAYVTPAPSTKSNVRAFRNGRPVA
jgi:hypothetical protein